MKRTDALMIDVVCDVVERFRFHSDKASSTKEPFVKYMTLKMCEIELWELWVLTQR